MVLLLPTLARGHTIQDSILVSAEGIGISDLRHFAVYAPSLSYPGCIGIFRRSEQIGT